MPNIIIKHTYGGVVNNVKKLASNVLKAFVISKYAIYIYYKIRYKNKQIHLIF